MKLRGREVTSGPVVIAMELDVVPAVIEVPVRLLRNIFKSHKRFLAQILRFVKPIRIPENPQLET